MASMAQAKGSRQRGKAAARPSAYQNSRNDILAVAVDLFSDQGFDGVTMRQVAKAAQVTSPTIYHFFGDKRGLYRAALLEAYARMSKLPAPPSPDGEDLQRQLLDYVEHQLASYDEQPAAHRLFLRDMLDNDASIRQEAVVNSLTLVHGALCDLVTSISPALDAHRVTMVILAFAIGQHHMEQFEAYLPAAAGKPVGKTARRAAAEMLVRMIMASAKEA